MSRHPREHARRSLLTALASVLSYAVIVVILLLAWPAALGGCTTMTVVNGHSMEPTFRTGDLVIARCATPKAGDVIVYRAPMNDQRELVIHRILTSTDGGWVTRGDNNTHDDPWLVPPSNVLGAAVIHIPGAGTFLRNPLLWASLGVAALAFALWSRSDTDRVPDSAEHSSADDVPPSLADAHQYR